MAKQRVRIELDIGMNDANPKMIVDIPANSVKGITYTISEPFKDEYIKLTDEDFLLNRKLNRK
jgi:hypothetical protein